MKHQLRKLSISTALILALLFLPVQKVQAPEPDSPPPPGAVVCLIVGVIIVGVVYVVIRGLCKMCKNLPPVNNPATNAPPVDPSIASGSADIILPGAVTNGSTFVVQAQPLGGSWSNVLSFKLMDFGTNLLSVVMDNQGSVISSNFTEISPYNGDRYAPLDLRPFMPAMPSGCLFRLLSCP